MYPHDVADGRGGYAGGPGGICGGVKRLRLLASDNKVRDIPMEAVLPLRISGEWSEHDLRRASMLIFSIDHFLKAESNIVLNLICRPDEIDIVKSALSADRVKINIVNEIDLIPELKKFPNVGGWYKQQLLKLASHQIVSDEEILILDADLFCCREFSTSDFFVDGKLFADWEARSIHSDWWNQSSKVLGVDANLDMYGLKPTPAILVKSVCEKLQEYLTNKYGACWEYLLGNLGWTEFTIYNLFCDKIGATHNIYKDKNWMFDNKKSLRSYDSFSSRESFDRPNWPRNSFIENKNGYFMVCNSNTRIEPLEIWQKIAPLVSGEPKLFGKKWS
ncbi:hypothetical protein M2322_002140 [Rhodoblastus acidophilus]|uniref:DUF6492 family protein n=1 Tax=Rhodoblastus acidophilus TaxID=1074 RepID=UPI002224ED19|nr:DUF6492 family protein [Rhodoblastus acidophilus]MCW2316592.1 hypothetical protein [Rhodoblastus acidophilus]